MESLLCLLCDDFYEYETPQDQGLGRGTWGGMGRERLTLHNTKIHPHNNQQNFKQYSSKHKVTAYIGLEFWLRTREGQNYH